MLKRHFNTSKALSAYCIAFFISSFFSLKEIKAQCTKAPSAGGEYSWTSLGSCANTSPYTGNVAVNNVLSFTNADIVLDINLVIIGNLDFNISLGGSTRLIVPDGITLVVQGNLSLANNASLIVSPRASVIVTGNLSMLASQLGGGGVVTGSSLVSVGGACFSSACGSMVFGVCTGTICTTNNVNPVICAGSPITTISPSSSQGCGSVNPGTFTVTATPAGYTLARWESSTDNGANWLAIATTSPGLTYAPGSVSATTLYRTVYTNVSGSNACLAYSSVATVQVSAVFNNPVITSQPSNTSACSGNSASFSVSATGANLNYQWKKGAANVGSNSPTYVIPTVTGASAGTYSVVITSLGCGAFGGNLTVTSNNATLSVPATIVPSVSLSVNKSTICTGSTAVFTAIALNTGGGTVTYTFKNGASVLQTGSSSTYSATFSSNMTVTSEISVTGAACVIPATASSSSVSVTVNSVDQPTGSGTPGNCLGAGLNLTANSTTPGVFYVWSPPASASGLSGLTTNNITKASLTASDAGTYKVYAVKDNCQSIIRTIVVSVDQVPDVSQPADQLLCNGATTSTVSFTGSLVGTAFNWTNTLTGIGLASGGTGNISSFTAVNTGTTNIMATINVTPVLGGCYGSAKAFTIQVKPSPGVNQPADQPICNGVSTAAVNFSSPVTGTAFNWTNNQTSIGLSASGNGDILSFTAINSGASTVTATVIISPVANLCSGSAKTFTYQVKPTPGVNQPADQPICNGVLTTGVTFSSPVTGTAFNWTNNQTSIGLSASGNGDISSFTAINSGTSIVSATITVTPVANLCSGSAKTFTYQIKPTPSVNQPANQAVCNGISTTAVAFSSPVAGTVFNWTNNLTSIGLSASGAGDISSFTAINSGTSTVIPTITVTPVASLCSGSPKNYTYTIYALPSIVSQPSGLSKCMAETATFVVIAGGTNPAYQWRKNGVNISGALSSSLSIPSVSASSAGTYTVLVSGTCSGNVLSNNAVLSISSSNTWSGAVSQDWFTPGNWTCGSIPSRTLSAVIPSAIQYPIISTIAPAVAKSVSIASGASFTLSESASLSVYGDWTNNGTLNASGSTIAFKGTDNQVINAPGGQKLYNLSIGKNAGSVTLSANSGMEILANGTVKIDSGTLDLNHQNLILKSTAPYVNGAHLIDSTARILKISGFMLNADNFSIERYISTPPYSGVHFVKTRFLSTSVTGMAASQWADSLTILGGSPVNGFVQRSGWGNNLSTLLYYQESSITTSINTGFKSVLDKNTTLTAGKGYAVSVGYDAKSSQVKYPSPRNYVILKMKGEPVMGDFAVNITKSGADPYGWNLLGNPYPCELNWNSLWTLNSSKVSSTMVILDPNGGIFSGQHYYYNARTGRSIDPRYSIDSVNYSSTTRLNPSFIASSQAFFVFSKVLGSSSFQFQESAKVQGNFNTVANFREDQTEVLNIGVSNGTVHDNTLVFFNPDAKEEFDADWDCYKINNASFNISTNTFGRDMAMNGIPYSNKLNIPVKVSAANGRYKLIIDRENVSVLNDHIFLKDKFLHISREILPDLKTVYNFEISADKASSGDRFVLISAPSVITVLSETSSRSEIQVYPNPALSDQVTISLSNPSASAYSVEIISADGVPVLKSASIKLENGNKLYINDLSHLTSGVYSIKVSTDEQIYNCKLVFIK